MAWNIDATHSSIGFSAKHMMFTTVRGQFREFDGEIVVDETNPTQSYAEGTVQTASLTTGDANRDAHLRSPDFFDVEAYPTMRFRSTRIEALGGNRYRVAGDLTIKDSTREVVFDVTDEGQGQDPWGNQRRGFSATATVNRKDFGLTWNVALETGGWLVSDEIRIAIDLQVVQQVDQPEAVLA